MMKRLKDPIYGYIEIDTQIIDEIVDTPNFQRLRDIIQTTYSPLYASAVHNRFVHSLGVYYLGRMASESIQRHFKGGEEIGREDWKRFFKIFEYACILHDVGHAPFSHAGEEFYLGKEASRTELHQEIISLTEDQYLDGEIHSNGYRAAPHELMSVVVGLRIYGYLFESQEEKSFFARCITGYQYASGMTPEKTFLNGIISLLNSSVIDVDKLDYLIRDAYTTGFSTVSIDYERLLKSIRIMKTDKDYEIVYTKGAVSVLENVVFARDEEAKWILNHPIVLYDSYLLRHAVEVINKTFQGQQLFSFESLTCGGKELAPGIRISLLSDGDVRFLIKNVERDAFICEYFSRKDRRHPLWKSEPEYKAIFQRGFNDHIFSIIEEEFDHLGEYLHSLGSFGINQYAFERCRKEIETAEKSENQNHRKQSNGAEGGLKEKKRHLRVLECLKKYAESQKIDFDFIVIKANQFSSGFSNTEFGKLKIAFPELKKPCRFQDVTTTLSAQKSTRDKFFYLFYRRKNRSCRIDLNYLAALLGGLAMEESFE